MLNQTQKDIVKQTVPVLEQHGTQITSVFYQNMFAEHPELLDIFNKTNQTQGRQQTALATAVLAAAKHIDNLSAILPHVTQISHKHRALQIKPEHYPIVGKHLLKAIKQVLGESATDEVIDAWAAAYGEIADVFISIEKQMYDDALWQDFVPFTVVQKNQTGQDICHFVVKPVNDTVNLNHVTLKAGQYITVKTHPQNSDNLALRHYSLCSTHTDDGIEFAVKRDTQNSHRGLVSNHLHDHVNVGDEILLSAPAGDFLLDESLLNQNDIPLVLISAGVGITPVLSMLEAQIDTNPKRPIVWVYACQNAECQAFGEKVAQLASQAENFSQINFYSDAGQRLDENYLKTLPKPIDVYVCGSINFMETMINQLSALSHEDKYLHFEPFGPKMSLYADKV